MPNEDQAKGRGRIQIPISQIKVLYVASAGQCSFPGCSVRGIVGATTLDDATVVTEAAHIHAYEDGGPRADIHLSLKDRNKYVNLIAMCPTHHSVIDKQPLHYDADRLRSWKKKTEEAVQQALQKAMPLVTFYELELVTKVVLAETGTVSNDYRQLAPIDKMVKNGLSPLTREFLLSAIGQARTVNHFVQEFSVSDGEFASRLREGFVRKYRELKSSGLEGDELFSDLLLFASGGRAELKWQAAGLAVLGYFFEACEVFEK